MKFPSTPSFRLENKRALVTGASRGIGVGAAIALSEVGSEVIMLSRSREDLEKIKKRELHVLEVDEGHKWAKGQRTV